MLEVEVTSAGEDTTFGRVRDLILSAEQTKLPIMRIIDQYGILHTTSSGNCWYSLVLHSRYRRVVSVLVIACPCAFILASPTAMVAALAQQLD